MNGENESASQATANQNDGSKYERSSISFPYYDLAMCLKLVGAISRNAGARDCTDDQIAAWIDLSPKSSGFRSRMTAARLFGLVEQGQEQGTRLSTLGLKTVDSDHEMGAKVQAFLHIPLFKRVYENWRGQQVPPPAALERAISEFGVAKKQAARARQTLERSATTAGFYEQGHDRLVQPGLKPIGKPDEKPGGFGGGTGDGNGDESSKIDPIIQGLINRLPTSGDEWPMSERKLWMQILESSFELVYTDVPKQLSSPVETVSAVVDPTHSLEDKKMPE